MNTSEKVELTASICHIGRFSKSGIPITITKPRKWLTENNKKKNAGNCKTLYVSHKLNKSKKFGYIFHFYVGEMLYGSNLLNIM